MILRAAGSCALRSGSRHFSIVQEFAKRTLLERLAAGSISTPHSLGDARSGGAAPQDNQIRLNEDVDSASWKSIVVRLYPLALLPQPSPAVSGEIFFGILAKALTTQPLFTLVAPQSLHFFSFCSCCLCWLAPRRMLPW